LIIFSGNFIFVLADLKFTTSDCLLLVLTEAAVDAYFLLLCSCFLAFKFAKAAACHCSLSASSLLDSSSNSLSDSTTKSSSSSCSISCSEDESLLSSTTDFCEVHFYEPLLNNEISFF